MRGKVISKNKILADDSKRYDFTNASLLNAESLNIDDIVDFEVKDDALADEIYVIAETDKQSTNKNMNAEVVADKIENVADGLSSQFQDKKHGRIKMFGILASGLILFQAIFSFLGADFNTSILSLIATLVAFYYLDAYYKTKAFQYIMITLVVSFIALLIFAFSNISLYEIMGSQYRMKKYIVFMLGLMVLAAVEIYCVYKAYIEVCKASNIRLFQISAILLVASMITGYLTMSDFFSVISGILYLFTSILLIISWLGVKEFKSVTN
jgi:hypothetical protein